MTNFNNRKGIFLFDKDKKNIIGLGIFEPNTDISIIENKQYIFNVVDSKMPYSKNYKNIIKSLDNSELFYIIWSPYENTPNLLVQISNPKEIITDNNKINRIETREKIKPDVIIPIEKISTENVTSINENKTKLNSLFNFLLKGMGFILLVNLYKLTYKYSTFKTENPVEYYFMDDSLRKKVLTNGLNFIDAITRNILKNPDIDYMKKLQLLYQIDNEDIKLKWTKYMTDSKLDWIDYDLVTKYIKKYFSQEALKIFGTVIADDKKKFKKLLKDNIENFDYDNVKQSVLNIGNNILEKLYDLDMEILSFKSLSRFIKGDIDIPKFDVKESINNIKQQISDVLNLDDNSLINNIGQNFMKTLTNLKDTVSLSYQYFKNYEQMDLDDETKIENLFDNLKETFSVSPDLKKKFNDAVDYVINNHPMNLLPLMLGVVKPEIKTQKDILVDVNRIPALTGTIKYSNYLFENRPVFQFLLEDIKGFIKVTTGEDIDLSNIYTKSQLENKINSIGSPVKEWFNAITKNTFKDSKYTVSIYDNFIENLKNLGYNFTIKNVNRNNLKTLKIIGNNDEIKRAINRDDINDPILVADGFVLTNNKKFNNEDGDNLEYDPEIEIIEITKGKNFNKVDPIDIISKANIYQQYFGLDTGVLISDKEFKTIDKMIDNYFENMYVYYTNLLSEKFSNMGVLGYFLSNPPIIHLNNKIENLKTIINAIQYKKFDKKYHMQLQYQPTIPKEIITTTTIVVPPVPNMTIPPPNIPEKPKLNMF